MKKIFNQVKKNSKVVHHPHYKMPVGILLIIVLYAVQGNTQTQRMKLDDILTTIQQSNPSLKMYDAEIRSADEAAKGARSWMAPELASGFFATPYNTKYWQKSTDGNSGTIPGMGQYTISVQQFITNRSELNANENYLTAVSSVSKEEKKATLNRFIAAAKKSYYSWIVSEKKLKILEDNEEVLNFMIKSAELRLKNNIGKMDAYYKAKAALGNIANQRVELENEIRQRKITLNTLMNRNKTLDFEIDTAYVVKDYILVDSSYILKARSDIRAIDKSIRLTYLQQQLERTKLKPQFGIRFENMFAFGGQPNQYTLMGMVRLPFAKWSSKQYKANIESLTWKAESYNQQKQMVLNEALGEAAALLTAINNKKKQVLLYRDNIIPALRKNLQSMQLGYEQNTEELFTLFDAWQVLNITQLDYFTQLTDLLLMQAELDRVLEQK